MIGLLLVGGQGTRLRPLTLATPKPMLPVANRPMIERIVARLAGQGIERVVLSLGYQPEAFQAAFPDGHIAGLPVVYAVEPEPLDTAGAIRFAAEAGGVESTFTVFNGDVLTTQSVSELLAVHRRTEASATIALTPVDDPSRFGVVPTADDGRVLGFIEKPPAGQAPTNEINAGTYVLEPSVLELIEPGRRVSIERETFPMLVEQESLYAVCLEGYWLDTGTPAQYRQAHTDLLDRAVAMPSDATAVAPGVWTQGRVEGVEHVEGPALLGEAVVIGVGATVTRSVLGPGVTVGAGARVHDSVVMGGVTIGERADVSESIVGVDASIGEGAVVAGDSIVGFGAAVPAHERLEEGRFE